MFGPDAYMGLYKNPVSFQMTQDHVIVCFFAPIVFSGGEPPVDKKCEFSSFLFCGCESILGRESADVIFCFHFLSSPFILHSFPLMFLSFCVHVLSFCVHFLSFCFHVLSCSFAMYQRYRSSKTDMLKPVRWVSIRPNTRVFSYFVIICVIVWLSFWRPVQVAIFRLHEHVHV